MRWRLVFCFKFLLIKLFDLSVCENHFYNKTSRRCSSDGFLSMVVNLLISIFHPQDIQEAHAGQIVAVFGVDCASGLTSLYHAQRITMPLIKKGIFG